MSIEDVLSALEDVDAAIVLHEPGQFTDAEIENMGLGKLISTEYVGGKRIRTYDIREER
jgi:hypothetical protein